MASGVEMLGQMSETEALAGPVSGGNMVVKPNEVPVGGAAMLAKALRGQANKGIGGIYELPSQKAVTPEFMQMAEQNVKTQEAEQRNRYPNNFADDEGGILVLPRNLRTAPGVPQTSLAYITDEEKAILGLLKPGTPHRGPEEVPSYDSLDYVADDSGSNQGATESSYDTGGSSYDDVSVGQGNWNFGGTPGAGNQQGDSGTGQGTQSYDDYYDQYEASVGTPDEVGVTTDDFSGGSNMGSTVAANVAQQIQEEKKQEEQQKIADKVKKANETNDKTLLQEAANDAKQMGYDLKNIVTNFLGDVFGFGDDEKKDKDKKEEGSFIDKILSGGAFGTLMDKISKPTAESFTKNNYKAIMKNKYFNEDGTFKGDTERERKLMEADFDRFTKEYSDLLPGDTGNPNEMRTMKDVIMSGKVPEGSDLERRLNPDKYWSENKPVSSLDFKDMAEAQAQGKLAFTKANTQAIQQGRELLAKERGGNQNNRPRFMQETQEEIVETPDGVIDEEAQTMKYTSPRTGDKEIDVPLQRRFRTDPTQDVAQYRTAPRTESDILKYMTEGTTGEGIGLEPFSEYQRRRRKAMGLEPLGLYG
jgi:hypothetical protein